MKNLFSNWNYERSDEYINESDLGRMHATYFLELYWC